MRTDLNLTGWNGASERRRLEVLMSWVDARVRQMKNTHMGRQKPSYQKVLTFEWFFGSVRKEVRFML